MNKVQQYHKKYYEENKEKMNEYSTEWKKLNKEKWNEYQREYKKNKHLKSKQLDGNS